MINPLQLTVETPQTPDNLPKDSLSQSVKDFPPSLLPPNKPSKPLKL